MQIDGDAGLPMTPEAARDRQEILAREAAMYERLAGHSNVAPMVEIVRDATAQPGQPDVAAIVMELALGGDVFKLMTQIGSRCASFSVLDFVAEIRSALLAAMPACMMVHCVLSASDAASQHCSAS